MKLGKVEAQREFCREQLADYQVPESLHSFDAFPPTGSGKAKRQELRRVRNQELSAT